jgi:hypothetical protein
MLLTVIIGTPHVPSALLPVILHFYVLFSLVSTLFQIVSDLCFIFKNYLESVLKSNLGTNIDTFNGYSRQNVLSENSFFLRDCNHET